MTTAALETLAKATAEAFAGVLTWKWDGRFQAAVAEFDLSAQEKVRAVLRQHLAHSWDSATLGTAPAPVQAACAGLGGLQRGQLAFASGTQEPLLFAAWWPWGNGRTVSLRVIPRTGSAVDPETLKSFRAAFG